MWESNFVKSHFLKKRFRFSSITICRISIYENGFLPHQLNLPTFDPSGVRETPNYCKSLRCFFYFPFRFFYIDFVGSISSPILIEKHGKKIFADRRFQLPLSRY